MVKKLLNGSLGAFANWSRPTHGSPVVGVSCEVPTESLMYEEGSEIAEVSFHDFWLVCGKENELGFVRHLEGAAGHNTVCRRIA